MGMNVQTIRCLLQYALHKFFMTTVHFLCLIFILLFHSFTDKIASHVAVK